MIPTEDTALSLCAYKPAARNEQRSEAIYCCSTILHAKALAGKKITKNRQNCATFERKKKSFRPYQFLCVSVFAEIFDSEHVDMVKRKKNFRVYRNCERK